MVLVTSFALLPPAISSQSCRFCSDREVCWCVWTTLPVLTSRSPPDVNYKSFCTEAPLRRFFTVTLALLHPFSPRFSPSTLWPSRFFLSFRTLQMRRRKAFSLESPHALSDSSCRPLFGSVAFPRLHPTDQVFFRAEMNVVYPRPQRQLSTATPPFRAYHPAARVSSRAVMLRLELLYLTIPSRPVLITPMIYHVQVSRQV